MDKWLDSLPTVVVVVLDPSAGQKVRLVGQPGVVQVFESQEEKQDGGNDLAGDALQHGRPTGQLHQDAQANDAHLTVMKTAAGTRKVSVEPPCVWSGTGAGAEFTSSYQIPKGRYVSFFFRIFFLFFIYPKAS